MLSVRILCALFLVISVKAIAGSLDQDALQLQQAYNELQLNKRDPARQLKFIQLFPTKARDFNRLFNSSRHDQLWNGSQYIFELEQLSQSQPVETFKLMVSLGSELPWAVEAPSTWQFVLMKIAIDNPFEFANQYALLSGPQKHGLVQFLSAGNKGPAIGYNQLVEILRRIGKSTIADELQAGLH